jgi:hypothetical protein
MAASVTDLSILSYPDGFIFYESTPDKTQMFKLTINAMVDFPGNFEKFVLSKNWTTNQNINVKIIEHGDRFLLLPNEVEDSGQIRSFFDFVLEPVSGNTIVTNQLNDGKQKFCYEISSERISCYKRMFSKFNIQNDAFAFTEWTLNKSVSSKKPVLLVRVYKRSLQLFAAGNSEILFANSFQFKTIAEVTYFSLRCMEQTGLDPFVTDCFVCSETENLESLITSLKPYIKNLYAARITPHSESIINLIKA